MHASGCSPEAGEGTAALCVDAAGWEGREPSPAERAHGQGLDRRSVGPPPARWWQAREAVSKDGASEHGPTSGLNRDTEGRQEEKTRVGGWGKRKHSRTESVNSQRENVLSDEAVQISNPALVDILLATALGSGARGGGASPT